ncbi:hypothetical protein BAOM_0918 [Peribacillus asahii]|uniref:Uncharacterized protein n=1 Tax=Peribacillus asahii TaxID=228899 RepID=A0A3T0KM93_9BACI|nr:hypothetical protein BAOM_0918 [Peribacillus asahii]
MVHPGFNSLSPVDIVQILTEKGVPPHKVIIAHIEVAFPVGKGEFSGRTYKA